jgi:hypothetical protein
VRHSRFHTPQQQDPDTAIRASIEPAFIANLQSDGRHIATADTLATITAVHESNITIPTTTDRSNFTQTLAGQWRGHGYNAVIVNTNGRPMAQGHDITFPYTHCCEENSILSTNYTMFVGTRDHPMIVENRGDIGLANWAFVAYATDYWVRYGFLVFYLPYWDNALFGMPGKSGTAEAETRRDRAEFPGWFVE